MRRTDLVVLMLLSTTPLAGAEATTANFEKEVERLVAALDDDDFIVRERATEELIRLGKPVIALLQKARDGQPTFEVATRLDRVLAIHARAEQQAKLAELARQLCSAEPAQLAKIEEELVHLGPSALAIVKGLVEGKQQTAESSKRADELLARVEKRIQIKQLEVLIEEVQKKQGR